MLNKIKCFHIFYDGYGIKYDEYQCRKCGLSTKISLFALLQVQIYRLIGRVVKT